MEGRRVANFTFQMQAQAVKGPSDASIAGILQINYAPTSPSLQAWDCSQSPRKVEMW